MAFKYNGGFRLRSLEASDCVGHVIKILQKS